MGLIKVELIDGSAEALPVYQRAQDTYVNLRK